MMWIFLFIHSYQKIEMEFFSPFLFPLTRKKITKKEKFSYSTINGYIRTNIYFKMPCKLDIFCYIYDWLYRKNHLRLYCCTVKDITAIVKIDKEYLVKALIPLKDLTDNKIQSFEISDIMIYLKRKFVGCSVCFLIFLLLSPFFCIPQTDNNNFY